MVPRNTFVLPTFEPVPVDDFSVERPSGWDLVEGFVV
jgi:hypothetical protein